MSKYQEELYVEDDILDIYDIDKIHGVRRTQIKKNTSKMKVSGRGIKTQQNEAEFRKKGKR